MAGGLPADRSYNKHTVYYHIKIKWRKIIMVKVCICINSAERPSFPRYPSLLSKPLCFFSKPQYTIVVASFGPREDGRYDGVFSPCYTVQF